MKNSAAAAAATATTNERQAPSHPPPKLKPSSLSLSSSSLSSSSSSSLLLLLLLLTPPTASSSSSSSSSSSRHRSTFVVGRYGHVVPTSSSPPPLDGIAFRTATMARYPPPARHRPSRDAMAGSGWSSTTTTRMRTRTMAEREWTIFGRMGVDDYLASLDNYDGRDGDEDEEEIIGRDDGDGTGERKKKGRTGKYVGRGRLSPVGGGEDERNAVGGSSSSRSVGGLFDVNDYFGSLGNDAMEDVNTDDDDDDGVERGQPRRRRFPPSTPATKKETTTTTRRGRTIMTYEEVVAYNNARLCPKLFLTQSAIQSFIYLLEECRDPHSGRWIEDFLGTTNLGNYHGTGAIDVTRFPAWDSALYGMMEMPNTKTIVMAKRRGRGHGGWSRDNPYLEERYVEFGIDIRPASLVQRLLAVRSQLASEFERDLEIVRMVDVTAVMGSYYRRLAEADSMDRDDAAAMEVMGRPQFDRVSVDIFTNYTEYQVGAGDSASLTLTSSSPFRRGNFDLLYGLCTQAAAHRLLRELQHSASSSSSSSSSSSTTSVNDDIIAFQWFKQFYSNNAPLFFDGDQNFGRADDFIDALLRTPPRLVGVGGDANAIVGLTDPLRMVERIIATRCVVASEWIGMMGEVSEDHRILNDVLIRVVMGRSMDESGNVDDVVCIREETTFEELADDTGSFD
ncbi:hypothetical protein ACHAXA_001470 [Cyclostephanos tholiformis]|uniref:Uncharacterized protein n=1 Tax=Cyclostephanos tholiformis TaxID=382380 RepID=A0ABD3RYZ7_9STRA